MHSIKINEMRENIYIENMFVADTAVLVAFL